MNRKTAKEWLMAVLALTGCGAEDEGDCAFPERASLGPETACCPRSTRDPARGEGGSSRL